MPQFTAKLTGNRRDVETGSPKALIVFIQPPESLNRNHCWVDLELVEYFQPKGHCVPIHIRFNADLKPYKQRGKYLSHTLTNITDIEVLQ